MAPTMARLEVVAGRAIGMWILIDDELLIGRHADGAGRLADDEEISRSHARITLDRSGFCAIEDLGSTNGTFVNGLRISGPQTLSVGDTLELGGTTLVVRGLPDAATERSPTGAPTQPTVVPRTAAGTGSVPASQETPATGAHATGANRSQEAASSPSGAGGAPATAPPILSLRLEVDFAEREATVALDDERTGSMSAPSIRLVFEGDTWRATAP